MTKRTVQAIFVFLQLLLKQDNMDKNVINAMLVELQYFRSC